MRLSCNGCRVLRKGCGDGCTLRPCLQWIKNPESQANATVFLAKFYGRAGLINLINAGPEHLRPAIFKSLLYEACGRIVNPIYGSAGLLWSASWQLCQAAVDAVLRGMPITQLPTESAISSASPPLKACDIRHVVKGEKPAPCDQLHKVNKSRTRFKNTAGKPNSKVESASLEFVTESLRNEDSARQSVGSFRQELGTSHNPSRGGDTECVSAETVEVSLAEHDERADGSDVDLELTLGIGQLGEEVDGSEDDTCTMSVGSRAGQSLYRMSRAS